jgi:hypothetical protein
MSGMNRVRFFSGLMALLLAMGLSVQMQAQTENWQSYSYASEGFSASYPAAPELQKQNVPTAAGSYELRSYIATSGSVALFVGICDYGSVVSGKDPNVLLQGAKNGALENSKSHLTREQKITVGIYPGIEFEAASDQAHFTARIYMVGSTLYQTLVVTPLNTPYAGTTRFLDSFQLIPRTH